MNLRILLLVLGLQKACDVVAVHPPIAEAVLRLLGVQGAGASDPMLALLARLWGCASLVWAYCLLRAASQPQTHQTVVLGSAIGFAALSLVGMLAAASLVRLIGILFLVEAALLLVCSYRMPAKREGGSEPQE